MEVCYLNPSPVYQKAINIIASISNAQRAVVTTYLPNVYISDMYIRFYIPEGHGMEQINRQQARITVINDTTFEVDIDTTYYDPYIIPDESNGTCAQIVPVGVYQSIYAPTRNVLTNTRRT